MIELSDIVFKIAIAFAVFSATAIAAILIALILNLIREILDYNKKDEK